MADPRTCTHCGAAPKGNDSRFCSYCGSELPVLETTASESVPAVTPYPKRFAALKAYPTYDELRAHIPSTSSASMGFYGMAIGGGFFAVIATLVTLGFATVAGPIAIIPGIMVVFGLSIVISSLSKAQRFSSSPLTSLSAAVLDERVKVRGGGKNSSSSTSYFAMLLSEDGERKEYKVPEAVASKIVPGDIGVAFVKMDYLIDYIPVPV